MTAESCGYPTARGPCKLPAGEDGTCHLDGHTPDETDTDDGDPEPGRQRTRARARVRGV